MVFCLRHIALRILALSLLVVLALPSVIKSYHGIFEHQDVVCTEKGDLHFHETEVDCDFQKFNSAPQWYAIEPIVLGLPNSLAKEKPFGLPPSVVIFESLPYSLRGPPFWT